MNITDTASADRPLYFVTTLEDLFFVVPAPGSAEADLPIGCTHSRETAETWAQLARDDGHAGVEVRQA